MIAKIGYRYIELCVWDDSDLSLNRINKEDIERISKVCDDFGLTILALGAHVDHLGETKEERTCAVNYTKKAIRLAAEIQVPVVTTFVTRGIDPSYSKKTAILILIDSATEEAKYAEQYGVKIALEPHGGTILNNIDDFLWFLEKVDSSCYQFNLDVSYFFLKGEDPLVATDRLLKFAIHAHAKGCVGRYPNFQCPAPSKEQEFPFELWIKKLKDYGYSQGICVDLAEDISLEKLEKEARKAYYHLTEITKFY